MQDIPYYRGAGGYHAGKRHFIAAHKSALVQADKLNELKIHTNPQGYSGPLIEARNLFDAFVIGSLAKGVYALVDSGKKQACSVKIASHTATITADGASDIKYTHRRLRPALFQQGKERRKRHCYY